MMLALHHILFKKYKEGAWVAQSVKAVTPDLGSGRDCMVPECEPYLTTSALH